MKLNDSDTRLHKCRINAKETSDEEKESNDSYVVFIEKLGEKRSVPLSSLRPLSGTERELTASHRCDQYTKLPYKKYNHNKYESLNAHRIACKKETNNFSVDYDAICKSLDFESYINLSNFDFASNNQQELIAYPMVFTQSNMSSNNNSNSNSNGGSKGMKNRGQNAQNQSNLSGDLNDKQANQMSKIDEENSYANIGHDSKVDSQLGSNQSTGYYQHQEQSVDGVPINQPHTTNYYNQGLPPTVYYCPTSEYNEQNMYSSEMVMPNSMYAFPQYHAPPMQPNMYAPVAGNQSSHYPVQVGGWHAGYNPAMNAQGKQIAIIKCHCHSFEFVHSVWLSIN